MDNFEIEKPEGKSLVYSPEQVTLSNSVDHSPTPDVRKREGQSTASEVQTSESSDLTDRARNLLIELRGPESPSRRASSKDQRISKLRARRKNDGSGNSGSDNHLNFVGQEGAALPDSDQNHRVEEEEESILAESSRAEETGTDKPNYNDPDYSDSSDAEFLDA